MIPWPTPSADQKAARSMHLLQLLDAGLVWAALLAAANMNGEHMSTRSWMLYVIIPFTPLVLEFFKFYARDPAATALQVFGRLTKALFFTLGFVGLLALGSSTTERNVPFLTNGGFFALILLFARTQLTVAVEERAKRKNRPDIP